MFCTLCELERLRGEVFYMCVCPECERKWIANAQNSGACPFCELERLRASESEISRLYEELRIETDGGSESMTHADAVQEIRDLNESVDALATCQALLREACEAWELIPACFVTLDGKRFRTLSVTEDWYERTRLEIGR